MNIADIINKKMLLLRILVILVVILSGIFGYCLKDREEIKAESNPFTAWETTSITFGDNVGKLTWEDGKMKFEGDAYESAKIFFDYFLIMYIDDYIEARIEEEKGLAIDEPEMILFEFTTEGEFAKEFRPQLFLKITNTDLSKCFIGDRLRLDINGEIYWIRLEKD